MAVYLANQIILGNLVYSEVIVKKPTLKTDIDNYLISKNRQDLITQ